MSKSLILATQTALTELGTQGLLKQERLLITPQAIDISVDGDESQNKSLLNFCANNYLGYADNSALKIAAKGAIDEFGLGMASVRFICGTQTIHRQLERELASFLGVEDTILFASCFDANAGIFETFLNSEDAIISDVLNHASIIDGIRLCKAQRFRYANNDMVALEESLIAAQSARYRLIVTDGVFSMDGILANLPEICELAERYDALVMVDDSHAVGFIGPDGTGTANFYGVQDKVSLLSGTFGKALGGAAGGYIGGPTVLIEMLRQKARPYLFSNALPPAIVAATQVALSLVKEGEQDRKRLRQNAAYFREQMTIAGFSLAGADHPIIPVMLGDAVLAQEFAAKMLQEGVYVIAFAYPVVPKNQARIRTQLSAAHQKEDIDTAIAAFVKVGKFLGVI
jgi:glycine C-acetyltransferase